MVDSLDIPFPEPDWRRILDAVNDCVWSADVGANKTWRYRYVSPAIERIAGRPADFFRAGRAKWLEVIHIDDKPRVVASDETLPFPQRDARDAEYRFRIVRPDGSLRWVRDVVRITPGEPIRLDGILADMTSQHQAELALRVSEERLRRIVDANPDAVLLVGPDRRVTLANPAAARLFGRRRNTLIGMTWEQLGIEQEPLDAGQSVVRGQQYSVFRPDGTRARVLMTMATLKGTEQEFAGFVTTFDDVTALVAASDQLARSEARARVLLEQMPATVWSIDRDLRITTSQGRALQDIGLAPDQSVGMTIYEYLQTEDPMHPAINACSRALSGESTYFETDHMNRGFATYLEPMRNERGDVTGAIAVSLDITQTRQLEMRLRILGRLEALGQLAGGAAHDINNLLTVLLGHLNKASQSVPVDHVSRQSLAVCTNAVDRAVEIAQQLLGVARGRDTSIGPIELNAVAREVLNLLGPALGRDVHVAAEFGAGRYFIKARPGQIHQILINLCVNSRDAMPLGGRLTISTAVRRDGTTVRLTVADTGVGMTSDVKARIYEPLFTTKEPGHGTGLGLPSVRGIVEELGGTIKCESTPGVGTRFKVDLPLVESPPEPTTIDVIPRGNETILLADDDPLVRQIAKEALETAGYSVIEAADGLSAVSLAKNNRPSPALAVIEWTMPRLSGRETTGKLREQFPGLPVLFTIGEGKHDGELDGAAIRLSKPYRVVDLLIAVRRILDGQAAK